MSGLANTGPYSDEEEADEEEMRVVAAFPGHDRWVQGER